jgi:tRNA-dihydrouridine synthase B
MAVARPWVFSEWADGVSAGPNIYENTALRRIDLLPRHFDEARAVRRFKKFALYFVANFRFGHTLYPGSSLHPTWRRSGRSSDPFFRHRPI